MPEHPLVPANAASAALAAPQPREAGRAPSSALVIVETDRGSVFASLRYARMRAFALEFLLDVVNTGDEPILATSYAAVLRGGDVPIEPYSVWIEPRSEAYMHLRLGPLAALTCRAAVVRIQGLNIHQRLEARMPRPTLLLGAGAGLALAGLFAVAISLLQPHASLAAASSVAAGASLTANYSSSNGAASWELDDASNGARVDGGTLNAPNGQFTVRVPRTQDDHAYVVKLSSAGRFGNASASQPLVALAPKSEAARIDSISLDNTTVPDGGTVRVAYATNARAGSVAAVDAQGTVWAKAPLSTGGSSMLQLPKFNRDKELQIRVTAKRGDTMARAGVGLTVAYATPSPQPIASASAAPQNVAAVEGSSANTSTPPPSNGRIMNLISPVVSPGGLVLLSFNGHPQHLHVQLIGPTGNVIDQRDVPQFVGRLSLLLPKTVSGSATVVATYYVGDSQQSEVQRITVR